MKKRILLVYPEYPTTYWSFHYSLPFIGKRSSMPPLGLMTVAAMLPQDFELRLVDLNLGPLEVTDVEWADLVFLSAMIVQKRSFEEIVRLCNDVGTPVVAGGPYPISQHQEIRGVDTFVLDEAELTLSRFLADLEAGRPQRLYRADGHADITQTPPPRFDLIDMSAYDAMPLQYSRGCPYSCEFCDIIEMFGRVQRTKTPEQFLAEMDAVYGAGFRGHLFLVDDNFVGNRRKTKELLRRVVSWQAEHRFPFTFSTEASIDVAQDPELLRLMAEAAFGMVFVGIETPDQETLAFTGKSQNLKGSILESVRRIQDHGIEVTGGFILGFDTDPPDIFDRQIRFIQDAAIPIAMVGLLTALPQTQLGRRLEAEGRLISYSTGNNTDLAVNFVPRMPLDRLISGYRQVLAELYRPRNYFRRAADLLRRMPPEARTIRRVDATNIRALLLSLVRQGFSSYGLTYLRFLAQSVLRHPRRFPDAVALAIKGYHFFVMTRHILAAEALADRLIREARALRSRVAAVVVAGPARARAGPAAQTRRTVLRLRARLWRRYRGLSLEMRGYVEKAFADFAASCRLCLQDLAG